MASWTRTRRGFPLFAVFLIALGLVLLLQTTGVLPWGVWGDVWRLWPVLIIVLGINIAFGGRMSWLSGALTAIALAVLAIVLFVFYFQSDFGVESVQSLNEPLLDAKTADVTIDIGAGTLSVGSLPEGSASLVDAELRSFGVSDVRTSVTRSGGHAEIDISMNGFSLDFFGDGDRRWDVRLSPLPRASIDVDAGASDLYLDLSDMNVADVSVDGGAADIEILAPVDAGHVNIGIDVGAASIVVVIPDHVGARIDTDAGISDLDIDEARFPRSGDVYQSRDFETSANRIDLEIDAGASSIEIR